MDFAFDEYVQMADFMRSCKGKVMVSINDHPAIREAFNGLHMDGLDIKYWVANTDGPQQVSKKLVITNWDTAGSGSLFQTDGKKAGLEQ
ncbi:adenine modification methytransferase [Duganella sp. CT11-25]|uniref:adenine modification methytransferase n=1 Tax=unclassified Duganella TaxID=2636909 RepID=UPI0039B02846